MPNSANEISRTLVAILVFCLLAVGFAAIADIVKDDLKAGAIYEKQGQYFQAAAAYTRVLHLKPGEKNARRALQRIVDQAIAEKIAKARGLEAELKSDEAIAELEAARRFEKVLPALEITLGRQFEIAVLKEELVLRRVEALTREAERAQADGLWSAAIAHLQQIENLRPGFNATRERLYEVWTSWGHTNLREGRIRAAAERFEQAAKVPAAKAGDATRMAVVIRTGLATSSLEKGACRGALADLRAAERLAPGSVDRAMLSQAQACAGTCIEMRFTTDPEAGLSEGQLDQLRTETRRQMAAEASEYLHLRSKDSTVKSECSSRSMPGIDGTPTIIGPYSLNVRVTSLSIIRQPASSATRQTLVQTGTGVGALVTFEEYQEMLTGTLSGWISLADQRAGSVSTTIPVRVTGSTVARWQRNPVSTIVARDGYTRQQVSGVGVGISGSGKANADEARSRARKDLQETLIRNLSTETVRMVLSIVDVEPIVADPIEIPGAEVP